MLVIRFQRTGRKRQPSFRLVVQEKTRAPQSKVIEIVGFYNPRSKEQGLKEDRIKHWISKGAQPTETVANLLINAGLIEGSKRKSVSISKKRAGKIEDKKKADAEKAEAAKEAAAAAAAAPVEAPAPEPEAAAEPEAPAKEEAKEEQQPEASQEASAEEESKEAKGDENEGEEAPTPEGRGPDSPEGDVGKASDVAVTE